MRRQQSAPLQTPAAGVAALAVAVVASTDIGRNRQNNEDNFLVFDLRQRTAFPAWREVVAQVAFPGMLLAVADGMGGHQAGQVASQMCVDNLPGELLKRLPKKEDSAADWGPALIQGIETTSNDIYRVAKQNVEYGGMGTTLTAAAVNSPQLVVAQVGDSRAYRLRQGNLEQLTQDQTIGNTLRRNVPDAQVESRLEGILVQAVGALAKLEVEVTTADLEPGDLVLLCTDGLYRVVSDDEIVEIIRRPGSLRAKSEILVARANAGGGPDNITLVLFEVRKGGGD